jgi:hypothetical protein
MIIFRGRAIKSADEICDCCKWERCPIMEAVEALGESIAVTHCRLYLELLP